MPCIHEPETPTRSHWLACDVQEFRARFNQAPFVLTHHLADHALFRLPRLIELARELSARERNRGDEVYFDAGSVRVNQRWNEVPPPDFSVEEAIQRIEECG